MRDQILTGNLTMPRINDLQSIDKEAYKQVELMFEAMWFAYLNKGTRGTINVPYWAKRIANPKVHNIALKMLSQSGWISISTQSHRNWSEAKINESKLLEYVSRSELDGVRKYNKFKRYLLTNTKSANCADKVKLNGKVCKTGLNRSGFEHAGNTEFQFDINYMNDYKDLVVKLINKGIEKMIQKYPTIIEDDVNYKEIGVDIVDYYCLSNGTYTSGSRISDSRGRDIAGYLDKIGNPVGFKIMRALLIIPFYKRKMATAKGLRNKYLFIAELNGFKNGTEDEKVAFGKECYENKTVPHYDTDKHLDDLPEAIWCMRTYDDIEAYHNNPNHRWVSTIEID